MAFVPLCAPNLKEALLFLIKHAALCFRPRLQPMKSQRHRWRRHFHTFPWPCCSELWSQQPGVQVSPSCSQSGAWGANGSHREPVALSARFNRGNAKLWKWNSWGQGRQLCETILEQPCATEPDDQRCVLCVLSVTRGGLQTCSHPIFLQG